MNVKDFNFSTYFTLDPESSFVYTVIDKNYFLTIYNPKKIFIYSRLKEDKLKEDNLKEILYKLFLASNIGNCLRNNDLSFLSGIVDKILSKKKKTVGLKEALAYNPLEFIKPLLEYYSLVNEEMIFKINFDFSWQENFLEIKGLFYKFDSTMDINFGIFGEPVDLSIKKFDLVGKGIVYFVNPFDVDFQIFPEYGIKYLINSRGQFFYTNFVFFIFPISFHSSVLFLSKHGLQQLYYPTNYDVPAIVFSALSNYFGSYLNVDNYYQLPIPSWRRYVSNFCLGEPYSYLFTGNMQNSRFSALMNLINYQNSILEVYLNFLSIDDINLLLYLSSSISFDLKATLDSVNNLVSRRENILKAINIDYQKKRELSDIMYRDSLSSMRHSRQMYDKIMETNRYISNLHRETINESIKQREAFTNAFSAAVNNETYIKSYDGTIYRAPYSSGFDKLDYYEDPYIASVKNYDYSTKQYLESMGYTKMKEDMWGFVYEE